MSQITYYNPMANQAFSQAASQAAQFVNAGADNQRADQQLALRQNAQQFEQELIRNANRDRLLREAKRNEANKAIFDLLKAETPNGDIGLTSQFVGLGAARGLPTMEQGIQSQVQGMAQAAQQDGFERLLRERPDAIENASPALVELLRDRGSKASATRLAEVNARIAGLERRGLAPYAKQMIDEARGLGLDMKDSLLPVRDRIEGKQQQDADKQFMLTERGFQPGTPEWEREMQRSYKFSTDLYKAHVERQAQQQAQQQAAAEQAQQVALLNDAAFAEATGSVSPEMQLRVARDPAVSKVVGNWQKKPAPEMPDPEYVASLFQRLQNGDTAARAELLQLKQITPSAAFGGQRDTSAADDAKRRDEMWQQSQRLLKAAEDVREQNPALAAQYESQSRQLQQQSLAGIEKQTGPVLLSDVDKQRTLQTMKQIIAQFRQQNGRTPTEIELEQLTIQQTGQPQTPLP